MIGLIELAGARGRNRSLLGAEEPGTRCPLHQEARFNDATAPAWRRRWSYTFGDFVGVPLALENPGPGPANGPTFIPVCKGTSMAKGKRATQVAGQTAFLCATKVQHQQMKFLAASTGRSMFEVTEEALGEYIQRNSSASARRARKLLGSASR
jgi:hypothetical protein